MIDLSAEEDYGIRRKHIARPVRPGRHRADRDHRYGRRPRHRILPRHPGNEAPVSGSQHGLLRLRRRAAHALRL
ncbi:hypothetical protein SBA6_470013 [Candidatus Sulfopaludibacter sp. SbA6]|nr:hypothetical protein SBA6_470013 [Candidatus Sulfopaludibacter sp. SbA6]